MTPLEKIEQALAAIEARRIQHSKGSREICCNCSVLREERLVAALRAAMGAETDYDSYYQAIADALEGK